MVSDKAKKNPSCSKNDNVLITFLYISIATIGFSLNGPFGRMVDLPSGVIAWGRGLFASIGLYILLRFRGEELFSFHDKKDPLRMVLLGLFLSGNWYFFYVSIKTSSVGIAVVSLFTYPFVTSIIEPFFFKERWKISDLFGGFLVLIGIWFLSPGFSLSSKNTQGIIWGALSGLCFSIRNLLSRKLLKGYTSPVMSLYQFMVTAFFFTPFLFFNSKPFTIYNIGILFIFGAFITTLSLVIFTYSLNTITVSLASILLSTQPVVTVILNYFLTGEIPTNRTIAGGAIISLAVLLVSIVHHLKHVRSYKSL